jgi:hypothetical protein
MWALINKSDLSIRQIVDFADTNFDANIYVNIEFQIVSDFLKAIEIDGVISIVEDTVAKTAANKALQIAELNNQTWETILNEARNVYGFRATNRNEASILILATHSTYESMVSTPSAYVGAIFADQAAVLAYAQPKLAASLAFGNWRLGVLAAEDAQVAAIEAE